MDTTLPQNPPVISETTPLTGQTPVSAPSKPTTAPPIPSSQTNEPSKGTTSLNKKILISTVLLVILIIGAAVAYAYVKMQSKTPAESLTQQPATKYIPTISPIPTQTLTQTTQTLDDSITNINSSINNMDQTLSQTQQSEQLQ